MKLSLLNEYEQGTAGEKPSETDIISAKRFVNGKAYMLNFDRGTFNINKTNPQYIAIKNDLVKALSLAPDKAVGLNININGGASKIPYKGVGGNEGLAKRRGQELIKLLTAEPELTKYNLKYTEGNPIVGGPEYNNNPNDPIYKQFQNVTITIPKLESILNVISTTAIDNTANKLDTTKSTLSTNLQQSRNFTDAEFQSDGFPACIKTIPDIKRSKTQSGQAAYIVKDYTYPNSTKPMDIIFYKPKDNVTGRCMINKFIMGSYTCSGNEVSITLDKFSFKVSLL